MKTERGLGRTIVPLPLAFPPFREKRAQQLDLIDRIHLSSHSRALLLAFLSTCISCPFTLRILYILFSSAFSFPLRVPSAFVFVAFVFVAFGRFKGILDLLFFFFFFFTCTNELVSKHKWSGGSHGCDVFTQIKRKNERKKERKKEKERRKEELIEREREREREMVRALLAIAVLAVMATATATSTFNGGPQENGAERILEVAEGEAREAFETFKRKFQRKYGSPEEEERRFTIFRQTLERARERNIVAAGRAVHGITSRADRESVGLGSAGGAVSSSGALLA